MNNNANGGNVKNANVNNGVNANANANVNGANANANNANVNKGNANANANNANANGANANANGGNGNGNGNANGNGKKKPGFFNTIFGQPSESPKNVPADPTANKKKRVCLTRFDPKTTRSRGPIERRPLIFHLHRTTQTLLASKRMLKLRAKTFPTR